MDSNKNTSTPIRIAKNRAKQPSKPFLSHSVPHSMRFVPPQAPAHRPRKATQEPPPIELPPSPPIFNEVDVQEELKRRKERIKPMQPLSRSLNDFSWGQRGSLPSSSFLKEFQPSFTQIAERPADEQSETKHAASYSESSTIISMLRESSVTRSPKTRRESIPSVSVPHRRNGDDDLDLQFSISLDHEEDSGSGDPAKFSLDF